MKKTFSIVCRGSWLSLAQAELFTQKVKLMFPGTELNVIIRQTEGDKNQSTPLHLVEGKDFFTRDIQNFLHTGGADFAVHSMKDVSSEDFFKDSEYALFDRDDIRDVAIFNENIIDKLSHGAKITIGTSSPRRSVMAADFLNKALPWLGIAPRVEVAAIRGNVDKRLRHLQEGKFDGLILAAAGLNRLLRYAPAAATVKEQLRFKKMMLLPLFECPPAAGQGAIAVETSRGNTDAITVLQAVNDTAVKHGVHEERKFADKYGYGCSKEFGVFHLNMPQTAFTFAAGQDEWQRPFSEWSFAAPDVCGRGDVFSAADNMKCFFEYRFLKNICIDTSIKSIFIASHKAIHDTALAQQCKKRSVWAAGVKTWLHLAQKGIWVDGCADGLGLDILQPVWEAPLFQLDTSAMQIITNTASVPHWQQDGWKAAATYELMPALDAAVQQEISAATAVFWTSYLQYELCRPHLQPNVVHACPAGKTAALLQAAGLQPVVFPTIKAYQQWKSSVIRSPSAA